MNHDFGQSKIKELEKEIASKNRTAEDLINLAFSDPKLRNHWRVKFGLPEFEIVRDDGDMN